MKRDKKYSYTKRIINALRLDGSNNEYFKGVGYGKKY